MKVRKLAVALALAGGLGSGVAQALGLGEIELQSYLNEPLDAEINLRKSEGVDPDEVFVNIASEADYSRVGINRNYFLTKLQFTVTTAPDGGLVVNVSSREPLREPYLNFLLEVTWPSGKLMREYAVLVDPPVYAEESGVREQVAAPTTRAAQPETQRQPVTRAASPRATERSGATTARPRRDTFGPTGPSDTLWGIASQVSPGDGVTTQQVMLAIQDLNPNAFIDGNINRLKRGEVLRVPDLEQIRSRTRAEANQQVAVQNRALQQRAVDATGSDRQVAGTAPDAAGSDELKLLVADEAGSRDAEEGGSAGGDSQLAGGVDSGTAVAMEELERTRRENEELSGRVDDLQEQVETLQRLLELKDSQLAELQEMASETEQDVAEETPETDAGDQVATTAPEARPDEMATGEMADDVETTEETVAEPAMTKEAVASAEEAPVAAGQEDREADATVAAPQQAAPEEPAPDTTQPAPVSSFPGSIIDAIVNNPLYQFALGGGLILLLLLLLLVARRNASREKAFYEQLNDEAEAESDFFELTLDEEDEVSDKAEGGDPLAEADTYIAYGRMDQAAQSLESAISREPSRTDLRLKLLGVYADTQERGSFEKQFGELETLEDEAAIAEAQALRTRLEEAESMPSIDDLESQLHSSPIGSHVQPEETGAVDEGHVSDETLADQYESEAADIDELDVDFEGFDLEEDESGTQTREEDQSDALASLEETGEPEEQTEESDEGSIEFDLGDIDFDKGESEESVEADLEFDKEAADQASAADQEEDDLGIDFDFETESETEPTDELETELDLSTDEELERASEALEDRETPEDEAALEEEFGSLDLEEAGDLADLEPEEETLPVGQDGSLDESFLDELDAELEKVASEEDEGQETKEEGSLDDLELDVSDEDLALMEKVADAKDKDEDIPSLDEELGLEDSYPFELDEQVSALDETNEPEGLAEEEPSAMKEELPAMDEDAHIPVADQAETDAPATRSRDIDESELGDDDDFDFLSGTDEAATKLDLARAYMEMGDSEGARDILEEVALEGSDEQKTEAQELLKNLS